MNYGLVKKKKKAVNLEKKSFLERERLHKVILTTASPECIHHSRPGHAFFSEALIPFTERDSKPRENRIRFACTQLIF